MINFINSKYFFISMVVLSVLIVGYRVKQIGVNEERLRNLEVEHVERQKAKQAETAFDHCVAARGLAHCVPDNSWRKD